MITIVSGGSRGDFQPYIALAQQLKKLGKEVRIAGFTEHRAFIESYEIDFVEIEVDYEAIGVDPKMLQQAGSADNPLKMLLAFNKMKKYGIHVAEQTYSTFEGSELIVYHPGLTMGYFAAQEMGIPAVLASPFPMHETKERLSVITYGKSKPTAFNKKMSYKMIQGMLWLASSNAVKGYWKKRFGRLPENFGKPYERITKEHPALVACSNFVFERPSDWNENIHQFGYWFPEETTPYAPSKELEAFLNNGDKPIYIGFGSVSNVESKEKLLTLIVEATKKSGKRAIIGGMGDVENLPQHLFAVQSIPHSWLFDKVAAVCHHGGAGTTAAGLRAGVPSIIIPFSNDQFAWAHRVYDLGVGAKPIYRKELTAEQLAEAIQFATTKEIIDNAKKMATNIQTENGAARCAEVIAAMTKE